MANFSVEWLSKSYYEDIILQARDDALHSKAQINEFAALFLNPESCDYSSGSESEVGDDSEGEATQQRRLRTKFTSEQISKLENTFRKHKYLGAPQRRKIAEKLNLSETQVKTWFQNRRMKLKREVQDLRTEFYSVSAALLPPPLFQHPALRGQFPASRGLYQELQPPPAGATLPAPLHQYPPHAVILPPHFY
ncbi:ventral expressed homeobox [Channa argus]|uniref:ventral expressed homeobox n=1 Tax=Channa argus TaxID=215402 RepID=UPI00352225B3